MRSLNFISNNILKILFLAGLLLTFFPMASQAQNYNTALGGRFGYPFGVTVKHFFGTAGAIEGIVGFRGGSVELIALYEHHFYPAARDEFSVHLGFGGHLGFYNRYPRPYWRDVDDNSKLAVGLDGIVGIEWTFAEAPVNLGFDWKPGFNIYANTGFLYADFALSIRYAFR